MDGYIIRELRAAVLRDLNDFIPEGYYNNVRTDEDRASKDYWLSNQVNSVQNKKPQFTPRQLAADRVLEAIVGYCHEYKSADPVADAADGISPEYMEATQLKLLHDAVTQYVKYLPEHEAKALMFADAPVAMPGDDLEEQAPGDHGDDLEEQAPDDHDETLAALFEPLPVEALAKMFMTDVAQWKIWAERADRNGLKAARQGRAKFNPYKAGLWFVRNGAKDWDDARLYRTLANNLPARSRDKAHLLTGDID